MQMPYISIAKKVLAQQSGIPTSQKSVAEIYSPEIEKSNPYVYLKNPIKLAQKFEANTSKTSPEEEHKDDLSRLLTEQKSN